MGRNKDFNFRETPFDALPFQTIGFLPTATPVR
jgi:hypothetical protein